MGIRFASGIKTHEITIEVDYKFTPFLDLFYEERKIIMVGTYSQTKFTSEFFCILL